MNWPWRTLKTEWHNDRQLTKPGLDRWSFHLSSTLTVLCPITFCLGLIVMIVYKILAKQ
jgi:hypothetical protein